MLSLREKHDYEQEIAQLKKKVKYHTDHKAKIKGSYDRLLIKYSSIVTDRSEKAIKLIKNRLDGDTSLSQKDIAEECFLSIGTVYNLTIEVKKGLK